MWHECHKSGLFFWSGVWRDVTIMIRYFVFLSAVLFFQSAGFTQGSSSGRSVVFIHPDGAGVAHWQAARMYLAGPDGELNWDRLPHIGVYRGHLKDNLTASSNAGATIHAYGVKVPRAGFGSDGVTAERPIAASGEAKSLMHEAIEKGLRIGLVNSGSIIEPGTAAFVASVVSRKEDEEITRQVLASGVDIILSGGEEWMLPLDSAGRHGAGKRTDGRNLIEEAQKLGYEVVYNEKELAALPDTTRKVLGVFAAAHTFLDQSPADQKKSGDPTYVASAPSLAAMLEKTLALFGDEQFFLVVEEEGTDNFGNYNNAVGVFEALRRADQAFGVALGYLEKHPETLVITAADSEAGNFDVIGVGSSSEALAAALAARDLNGAPFGLNEDGQPFLAQPDRFGSRLPFVVSWGTLQDSSGGILVRAAGAGAGEVRGTVDNTDIYRIMRRVLFEKSGDSGNASAQ